MALSDTLTDDIMCYCMEHAAEINNWRSGQITFVFNDRRLVVVRPQPEHRVGKEITRHSEPPDKGDAIDRLGLDKRPGIVYTGSNKNR